MLVADLSTKRLERSHQILPRSYVEIERLTARPNQQHPCQDPEEVTCFNCSGKEHYASQCPHPRRLRAPRCGLCGITGHFIRSCTYLLQDAQVRFAKIYQQNNTTGPIQRSPQRTARSFMISDNRQNRLASEISLHQGNDD